MRLPEICLTLCGIGTIAPVERVTAVGRRPTAVGRVSTANSYTNPATNTLRPSLVTKTEMLGGAAGPGPCMRPRPLLSGWSILHRRGGRGGASSVTAKGAHGTVTEQLLVLNFLRCSPVPVW